MREGNDHHGPENCRGRAHDHDPHHRSARDSAAERCLGALRDADHQQRDDQGDYGHFERVEPQRADEACDLERAGPDIAQQPAGERAECKAGD